MITLNSDVTSALQRYAAVASGRTSCAYIVPRHLSIHPGYVSDLEIIWSSELGVHLCLVVEVEVEVVELSPTLTDVAVEPPDDDQIEDNLKQ